MTEYVYIKSTFRRWGVLPNPDYLAAVEPELQLPPVELYSPERGTEQCRILRSTGGAECENHSGSARESSCGRKSMASGLIRSEVEDEWYEFTPSQHSFDPVKNEWDLCKPLDSKANVPDNGEYDDDDDDYMGNWIDPKPPVGPSAPPSNPPSAPPAPAPSTAAPSTTVQSIDDNVHEPVSVSTTLRT
ncbi:hypothetical protein R3P38DRAFT_2808180 [Favolaschia claudopus]|uniref:Uncharacterized protein n=1 Tax=Favolaschia claudopus TaxID=2862362 RepID=A0AAV9ZHB1_9AGAR